MRRTGARTLRFAGQLPTTDAHGRATLTARLVAPGRRAVRAGALGFLKGAASIRVAR